MKTNNKKQLAFFWISLGLFAANMATVLAQPVEIDVIGGGFIIRGPSTLTFPAQPFSFDTPVSSAVNFKDVQSSGPQYLEVSDQNGGSPFSVALAADNLTPGGSGVCNTNNCIGKENLAIRNNDGSSPTITTMDGSPTDVSLDASTAFTPTQTVPASGDPASLSSQRVLLNGTGAAPGTWRIYPQLQQTTPPNTAIGDYKGTITITIMTI